MKDMKNNKGRTIWIFGLPCSGKTTLAKAILERYPFFVHLDGDIVRKGLNSDLGFSMKDRDENLRRVREFAKLLNTQGINVICTFITPMKEVREQIDGYLEGYLVECQANLQTCIKRDVKGMYKKALDGKIEQFTGITQKYDKGEEGEAILINTDNVPVWKSLEQLEEVTNYFEEYTTPTYYFQNSEQMEPHLSFIGRWNPFHKGHQYIILHKHKNHPNMPFLIYVRDTAFDTNAAVRAEEIKKWMIRNNYRGTICIIPDIHGVYIGRKVGYEFEKIDVPENIEEISGTKIRAEKEKNNKK